MAGLTEALIPADEAVDAGARKIRPNLQHFRREIASGIVLFALAICKLGKQLGFIERLLTGGFEGADPFEAPAVFGDGLGKIALRCAHGFEEIADAGAVLVESLAARRR
jgi:hypothetical protein